MVIRRVTQEHIRVSWIILGLLVHFGSTLFRGICQRHGYFQIAHENYRSRCRVISTKEVHSSLDCLMACMDEEQCSSCNFLVSGSSLHKCELNRKSQSSLRRGSSELVDEHRHFEAVVHSKEYKPCETDPCFNGGTCEENGQEFPQLTCLCPQGFTGLYCETLQTGNFLLELGTRNVNEQARVFLNTRDINAITSCVWLKPNSSEGIIFTFATGDDLMEMALQFNRSNIRVSINGEEVNINLEIPIENWSHLCFGWKTMGTFYFYFNGLRVYTSENISENIPLTGVGAIIPGFKQISPGIVDFNSTSNLLVSRLYFWNSVIFQAEIFRLGNEPYVSEVFTKPLLVNWKRFYDPRLSRTKTVTFPSVEPQRGNFDLRFSGNQIPVSMKLPGSFNLSSFTLCLWLSANLSEGSSSAVFTLKSRSSTVMKLLLKSINTCQFTLEDQTWTFSCTFGGDGWWSHLCIDWLSEDGRLRIFGDGAVIESERDAKPNQTLSEISEGMVELGDNNYVGDITSVNVWSRRISKSFIVLLAIQRGNAVGDLFSWTMLENKDDIRNATKIVPSTVPNERGQFDMKFPPFHRGRVNYIALENKAEFTIHSFSVCFWIKIPVEASQFTLISYAIPTQVNEFNIHFGTNAIWIIVNGNKRLLLVERQKMVGEWHHFFFQWYEVSGTMMFWQDGVRLGKYDTSGDQIHATNGFLVVGAQQTKYKVVSHNEYRFYGELCQLQMWKGAFNHDVVRAFAVRCSSAPGNFWRWSDMPAGINGTIEIRNSSECLKTKYGEA